MTKDFITSEMSKHNKMDEKRMGDGVLEFRDDSILE
jgi:hypothetical protein